LQDLVSFCSGSTTVYVRRLRIYSSIFQELDDPQQYLSGVGGVTNISVDVINRK